MYNEIVVKNKSIKEKKLFLFVKIANKSVFFFIFYLNFILITVLVLIILCF